MNPILNPMKMVNHVPLPESLLSVLSPLLSARRRCGICTAGICTIRAVGTVCRIRAVTGIALFTVIFNTKSCLYIFQRRNLLGASTCQICSIWDSIFAFTIHAQDSAVKLSEAAADGKSNHSDLRPKMSHAHQSL